MTALILNIILPRSPSRQDMTQTGGGTPSGGRSRGQSGGAEGIQHLRFYSAIPREKLWSFFWQKSEKEIWKTA